MKGYTVTFHPVPGLSGDEASHLARLQERPMSAARASALCLLFGVRATLTADAGWKLGTVTARGALMLGSP